MPSGKKNNFQNFLINLKLLMCALNKKLVGQKFMGRNKFTVTEPLKQK